MLIYQCILIILIEEGGDNLFMEVDRASKHSKLVYPELSYVLTGIFFEAHNILGRYAREKQYGDLLEKKLKNAKVVYEREFRVGSTGNVVDFLIENKILVELKAKRIISKDDYYQTQRYLQASGKRLALLVNFRNRYVKPIRVLRIDTDARKKFATLV